MNIDQMDLAVHVLLITTRLLVASTVSAPARIRKGQGAEALNRALSVASRKLGYTGGGNRRG